MIAQSVQQLATGRTIERSDFGPGRGKIDLHSTSFRQVLERIQSPIQWITGRGYIKQFTIINVISFSTVITD
jgi:hypothetical protein